MNPLPHGEVEVLLTGEARSRSYNRAMRWTALAAISLAACASTDADYRAARESWRGASYGEVVAAWGAPARSARSGARESHTWVTEDRVERGGGGSGGAGGVVFGADGGGRCERTLVFREGRAVGEDWSGDAGFCKRFARRR